MAAKEIAGLADSSVCVADHAGRLLSELVPSIQTTAGLVQEVAAASKEQSAGVAQISKSMAHVDSLAQQSAAAADELSRTAEKLANHSKALQQKMTTVEAAADSKSAVWGMARMSENAPVRTPAESPGTEAPGDRRAVAAGARNEPDVAGDAAHRVFRRF